MPNIDTLTLFTTVIIAIVGWITALLLQRKNLKDEHKVQIRYDIYKQFVELRKKYQSSIIRLATHTNPPLILMQACMIKWELVQKNAANGIQSPWSESECLTEGQSIWNTYVKELYDLYFEFNEQHSEMIGLFEDWMSPLTPLQGIAKLMHQQTSELLRRIFENLTKLQQYQSSQGYDWRRWKEEDLVSILNDIKACSDDIGSYSYDLTVLVHNELLSVFFKGKRPVRKTLDSRYRVLTKRGIVENLDNKKVREIRFNTEAVILDANIQLNLFTKEHNATSYTDKHYIELKSIAEGICPTCKNEIEVVQIVESTNKVCAHFICGHDWEQDA